MKVRCYILPRLSSVKWYTLDRSALGGSVPNPGKGRTAFALLKQDRHIHGRWTEAGTYHRTGRPGVCRACSGDVAAWSGCLLLGPLHMYGRGRFFLFSQSERNLDRWHRLMTNAHANAQIIRSPQAALLPYCSGKVHRRPLERRWALRCGQQQLCLESAQTPWGCPSHIATL